MRSNLNNKMIRLFFLLYFILFSHKVFSACNDQPSNDVDWSNCNFVESLDLSGVALAGAHVATIPPNVLAQMIEHPLTDRGIDAFLADAKSYDPV